MKSNTSNICHLCKRRFGSSRSKHHLIPASRKGKETVVLHPICHRKIHATFTEKELERYYHTIDRLLEHEEIQKFVSWVEKKDPDFYTGSNEVGGYRRR